eukprot:scaffold65473_cov75-Phaeocystis_antarctica.AAC.3
MSPLLHALSWIDVPTATEREPPSIEATKASSASMTTDSSVAAVNGYWPRTAVICIVYLTPGSEWSDEGATERLRLDVLPPEADGHRKASLARRRGCSGFDRRAHRSAHLQHSGRRDRDGRRGSRLPDHSHGGSIDAAEEVGDGQGEEKARARVHTERHAVGGPLRLDLRL